jgi:hypothetical protein
MVGGEKTSNPMVTVTDALCNAFSETSLRTFANVCEAVTTVRSALEGLLFQTRSKFRFIKD